MKIMANGEWQAASGAKISRRSGTLALRAPKGFEFGFEGRPISAVFGLFGADLGIERFAQRVAFARNSEAEQRATAGLSASFIGESLCQPDEALRGPGFSQPESDSLRRGFPAQGSIMAFDQ